MMPLMSLAFTAATRCCTDALTSASSLAREQEEATQPATIASAAEIELRRFIWNPPSRWHLMAPKRDQLSLLDRKAVSATMHTCLIAAPGSESCSPGPWYAPMRS